MKGDILGHYTVHGALGLSQEPESIHNPPRSPFGQAGLFHEASDIGEAAMGALLGVLYRYAERPHPAGLYVFGVELERYSKSLKPIRDLSERRPGGGEGA